MIVKINGQKESESLSTVQFWTETKKKNDFDDMDQTIISWEIGEEWVGNAHYYNRSLNHFSTKENENVTI